MYHHLEGELVALSPTRAVIQAGGVGYELRIPLSTFRALQALAPAGDAAVAAAPVRVRLWTHLQVLEDDLRLYGFQGEGERALFRIVISISGVGPSTALALLAAFDPAEFSSVVSAGSAAALRRVKGIGPKLSERLLLELRDRAHELRLLASAGSPGSRGSATAPSGSVAVGDAIAALVELGYSRKEAQERIHAAVAQIGGARGATPRVEELIQAALRARA